MGEGGGRWGRPLDPPLNFIQAIVNSLSMGLVWTGTITRFVPFANIIAYLNNISEFLWEYIGDTFQDTPGFIVNRLLVPYMGEAIKMVERGTN